MVNATKRPCVICKKESDSVAKYKCNAYSCDKCANKLTAKEEKTFNCKKCGSNHRIKLSTDVPRVQEKKHKTRMRYVQMDANGEPIINTKPRTPIRNLPGQKLPFDFKRCSTKINNKKPQLQLKLTREFQLDAIDAEFNDKKHINLCPIFDNKILCTAKDMMYIIDLSNGKLAARYESTFPGEIIHVACNSTYIYAVHLLRTGESHLAQYDMKFNFINDLAFELECRSFACTETKLYITQPFGFAHNYHTCTQVFDATTLEHIDMLGYEDEGEGKYTCPKFIEDAGRIVTCGDRVYFAYNDYNQANEDSSRIDMMDNESHKYLGHLDMTGWFRNFCFDATGQFVNYLVNEENNDVRVCVYSAKQKLVAELGVNENLKSLKTLRYCCTNDGHLVLLKNNSKLEIY